MQVPLKWINELVNIESINLEELIEKLTLGGFEVEEILEIELENKKQLALDISSTANRSDSLSIQGIATEIATLLNNPINISNYSIKNFNWSQQLINSSQLISSESDCSALIAVIIKNINDLTIPKWIKQKLTSSGITPKNNIEDFQNYILLETGYPFVFYDFDKICSQLNNSDFELSLVKANKNEKFTANNDVTYNLNPFTNLVKANNLPISIAGIIENKEFACSNTTKSILIEGSIFDAASIRQQSRNLGLRTDRSARYEKSLKSTYLLHSLYRLISLLRISNPTLTCNLHTFSKIKEKTVEPIRLRYQVINEILGPIHEPSKDGIVYLSIQMIENYLHRLNFKFSFDETTLTWKVNIPEYRTDDISREIDLIEEIGRLHGFNSFVTNLPKINKIGEEDLSYQTRKKITSCLLNLGLNELIHYSLVNEKTFLKNDIKLVNPLLSDCANLRSSLLPSLVSTVQENLKQSNVIIEGFEYGHVFSTDSKTVFNEIEYVAGVFGGIKKKLTWSDSDKSLTWFEAKGKIEKLFKQLNLITDWKNSVLIENKLIHPYRSAEIYSITGKKLGIFGQIHPILSNQLMLPANIYLFEFDVKLIKDLIQTNKLVNYQGYSLYPKIIKDLSFIINQQTEFKQLKDLLYCNGTEFLSEIKLLDEYQGSTIPNDCKSLCLQLVFQAKDKTLENKEIDNIIKNLETILINNFNATIRT